MADQGRWFKLWCSALSDDDLSNLDIADFGRWAKFGAHVKEHGTAGSITIRAPGRLLCSALQVHDFKSLIDVLTRLPGIEMCNGDGVTNATVTLRNWVKYQGDNSADRVRRFRDRVTPKKRREEKREDEKRKDPPLPPKGDIEFEQFWSAYPRKKSKGDAEKAWKQTSGERPPLAELLQAVASQRASPDWSRDAGQFIPYPASWLRAKAWSDVNGNSHHPQDESDLIRELVEAHNPIRGMR